MHNSTSQSPLLTINQDVLHEISLAAREASSNESESNARNIRALIPLASTCKHLRQSLGPQVFRKIRLHVCSDPHWSLPEAAVQAIKQCALVKQHTRECDINISRVGTQFEPASESESDSEDDLYGKRPRALATLSAHEQTLISSTKLAATLASLLDGMQKLHTLALALPHAHTEPFRQSFEEANVCLPLVSSLTLGPHLEWLVPLCPDVTSVTILRKDCPQWRHATAHREDAKKPVLDAIYAAGRATRLEQFERGRSCELWSIEAMAEAMPGISVLHLDQQQDCYPWDRKPPVRVDSHLLSTLSRFSRLRHLDLLGVAETPQWPPCGNAFDGPDGRRYYKRLVEETEQAYHRVAETVAPACPKLKTLQVAVHSTWTVERSERGEFLAVRDDNPEMKGRR